MDTIIIRTIYAFFAVINDKKEQGQLENVNILLSFFFLIFNAFNF